MENNKPNIYQLVTDRIIASLERGCVPWKQPWISQRAPINLITARPYRGINTWVLRGLPFESHYFLSIEQVNRLGGKVNKGEKSCPVVFWKRSEKEDEQSGETKLLWLIRYYNVFNVEQCSGIPAHFIPQMEFVGNNSIDACKKIVDNMPNPPQIIDKAKDAFYVPENDTVHMPSIRKFKNSEAYYGTLFHELMHSTGHAKRLNREGVVQTPPFGSRTYSMEELIAEMGACFLASASNIVDLNFENSAGYIQGWLQKLKNDRMIIFKASSQAQRAVDYILNTTPIFAGETQTEDVSTS